ncbi:aminotransferase class V-fold PLP-dependent enzyme [Streptomyces sp. VRA16 Mangrove soil]|uniref:pyridoxal phosphate-dependent decarboxylase family protein n=1 Tax=Streptomyces sp. VRA16 Mangrove soil TaxID=2817434 RepID=UPI001A9CE6A6|nr:aminotransferase class V-fold PLP-dependent enzyme [Streptomyces sp. VRA16 Mangrove soil]MBO1331602.1 aspartate aminotransferase family protein [Streptomyces sp. VRA16 Mangrove soil]
MTTDHAPILARLAELRADDLPVHGGRTMAYVYDSGLDGLEELANAAQAAFAGVNGLDMTAFPSVVELENDLVRRATALLGGTAGTFTSGGTESCLLAVLTARQHARRARGITAPELVLPETAHAAFHKAAELFGLTVVSVPVDPETFRVRPADVAAALTERTALVVVSAPSYAHGVIDPVAEVAAEAARRGVLCHVDACIGGWYLGHLKRADEGAHIPEFGLTVPGVTSLSVDLHKYGYTAKGASLLLFEDAELRRHGWFAHASWPGYPVVNSTLQGTKSAGPLAAAWAVTEQVGTDGYTALSTRVHRTTLALADGIERIDGLRLLARPEASLIAVASDDPELDVFVVADEMRGSGWYLQPQPAFGASPANLHLTVTAAVADEETVRLLLDAWEKAVARARAAGPVRIDPAIVEAAGALDPDALTPEEVEIALALAGVGEGGALPERMAPVLAVLQALPPRLSERLLPEVIGRLYRVR